MKAYEIYQQIDPALVTRMLDWFREHDRNVYKSALTSLAQSRKLRPVFIQKKPLPQQYAWILKTLRSVPSEAIGEQLLQVWLMAGHQDMLACFCDGVGIEHDGKGSVTGELPESLDADKVKETVDDLLAKFDPEIAAVYLHVFNLQRPGGWPALADLLASDPRLALGTAS